MIFRKLLVLFLVGLAFTSCLTPRYTTHWIVNNDSDKEVSLKMNIGRQESRNSRTRTFKIRPGLQEVGAESFSKGVYSLVAASGEVSKASRLYVTSDVWVIINYTEMDSAQLLHKYGIIDMEMLQKKDGKYTGVSISTEMRKPPVLYSLKLRN